MTAPRSDTLDLSSECKSRFMVGVDPLLSQRIERRTHMQSSGFLNTRHLENRVRITDFIDGLRSCASQKSLRSGRSYSRPSSIQLFWRLYGLRSGYPSHVMQEHPLHRVPSVLEPEFCAKGPGEPGAETLAGVKSKVCSIEEGSGQRASSHVQAIGHVSVSHVIHHVPIRCFEFGLID